MRLLCSCMVPDNRIIVEPRWPNIRVQYNTVSTCSSVCHTGLLKKVIKSHISQFASGQFNAVLVGGGRVGNCRLMKAAVASNMGG